MPSLTALLLQLLVDCSKVASLPNLDITIHGVTYSLTGSQYTLQFKSQGQAFCLSGVMACDAWQWITCTAGIFAVDVLPPRGPLIILGCVEQRSCGTC